MENILKRIQEMKITFENCIRYINAKTKFDEKNLTDEKRQEQQRIELANKELELSISSKNVDYEDIAEELVAIMVRVLQNDLETTEDDVDKLIEMALEEEVRDKVEDGMKLTRIKDKNTKKDKN